MYKPDGFIDAPPEVLLALPPPGEDRDTGLCQRRRHLVLCAVDVAGGPPHLNNLHFYILPFLILTLRTIKLAFNH